MHQEQINIQSLVDEYATIVQEAKVDRHNLHDIDSMRLSLVETADWTPETADILINLAQEYGTFILRNALALAVALGIEDGSRGL